MQTAGVVQIQGLLLKVRSLILLPMLTLRQLADEGAFYHSLPDVKN